MSKEYYERTKPSLKTVLLSLRFGNRGDEFDWALNAARDSLAESLTPHALGPEGKGAIIIDTNVRSELRLPNPDQNVVTWFGAQAEKDLAIASFSVAEIEYGIAMTAKSNTTLLAQLTAWLEAILATQRILPLDATAAQVLGRMHAIPALRNLATTPPHARRPRFGGDLVIAAIAVAHNAAVATRNRDDFRLIARHCPGLSGVDPWTARTF